MEMHGVGSVANIEQLHWKHANGRSYVAEETENGHYRLFSCLVEDMLMSDVEEHGMTFNLTLAMQMLDEQIEKDAK